MLDWISSLKSLGCINVISRFEDNDYTKFYETNVATSSHLFLILFSCFSLYRRCCWLPFGIQSLQFVSRIGMISD